MPTQGRDKDHNTNKSLSIFTVEYDKKTDLATTRDMEVLSTYVPYPCDSKIPNW